MRSDEHLAQLDEVTVLLVVDFDNAPWVSATTHLTAIGSLHLSVGTHNSEWNLAHDLFVLGNGLLIVKLISWAFEDLDVMVGNVIKDLAFFC
jgi:hypothetical protein